MARGIATGVFPEATRSRCSIARSAAEEIEKAAPEGAWIVRAFNTMFAGTPVEGQVVGQRLDVPTAGGDDKP